MIDLDRIASGVFVFTLSYFAAKLWITEVVWPWWKRRYTGFYADMTTAPVTTPKGNQDLPHLPFKKKWQEVFNELPEDSEVKRMSQDQIDKNVNVVLEFLYFVYYGPLEAWCEKHLQGSYYLWCDNKKICIILLEERDRVFWLLKWGNDLPPYAKLDKAT